MKKSHINEIWNQFVFDGNQNALSKIYAETYDLLYDYGMRITPVSQIVEDGIQEMFISIIHYRKSIGVVKNVKGYLVSSFRRQLFLTIEKDKNNVYTEQFPVGYFDFFSSPEQEDVDQENTEMLHTAISECVNRLTEKQKEILYLRFNSEISYEDIALVLDISVESCYKSIYRTIKILRSETEKMIQKKQNMPINILSKKNMPGKTNYCQKVAI